MQVLVINCGSSSIKFALFNLTGDTNTPPLVSGLVERIGESDSRITTSATHAATRVNASDHTQAFDAVFSALKLTEMDIQIEGIGHRVVHGGTHFRNATPVDDAVINTIRFLSPLAPLHNPVNLLGIEICQTMFPHVRQVAVFDTAFHQTLPPCAYRYAVPQTWMDELSVRRYGFHGTSHQYLADTAQQHLGRKANLITLHLGNGASASAIRHGVCVDTSMGFTPLEGLIMGTRTGDIDGAAVLAAARRWGIDGAEHDLLHEGGLKGFSGTNDMREIVIRAEQGDEACRLAIESYCYRIKKYIGSYCAVLGKVDALVFSGGVGENSADLREEICSGLENLGIAINPELNREASDNTSLTRIDGRNGAVAVMVIKANEELAIARQTQRTLAGLSNPR